MIISCQSLEIILDLIEIKANALQIHDKDDARELNKLRKCRQELLALLSKSGSHSLERGAKEVHNPQKTDSNANTFLGVKEQ